MDKNKGTLHEDKYIYIHIYIYIYIYILYIYITISRSLLRMRNVTDKRCRECGEVN